jgi:hypothetical protein
MTKLTDDEYIRLADFNKVHGWAGPTALEEWKKIDKDIEDRQSRNNKLYLAFFITFLVISFIMI